MRAEPKCNQATSYALVSVVSEAPFSGTAESDDHQTGPDSGVHVASRPSTINTSEFVPRRKTVRFAEEPVKPLLYHREACAKDVKNLMMDDEWAPIKLNTTYGGSYQATGFDTMFMQTSLQTISVKRRVLIRFKAVQGYEKRRHQASADASEQPALGQLEYGNADYKMALQVSDVITAHDIGTFVDPGEIKLPASTCSGPLLHFGGFAKDMGHSFEDTLVPAVTAAAYKPPVQWREAPKDQEALDKWVTSAFPALQPANLEE